jgi:predicted dinucleotide-binding enzyme
MSSGLGKLWAAKGNRVFFGSRESDKAKELAKSVGANAQGGTQAEAAAFGAVVLLGVPFAAAEATVKAVLPHLKGKVLIDCTNAWGADGMLIPSTSSAGEEIARWAIGAKVVKAFNEIHFRNLSKGPFGNLKADVYYCSDYADAKPPAVQLINDADFEPIDAGPLKNARYVEALVYLWARLAFDQGLGAESAFKLLRR